MVLLIESGHQVLNWSEKVPYNFEDKRKQLLHVRAETSAESPFVKRFTILNISVIKQKIVIKVKFPRIYRLSISLVS